MISLALAKSGARDRERVSPADPDNSRAEIAETRFATLSHAGRAAAWMALRPLTGRTHQLRVHLLAIGYPILGDPKYNTSQSKALSGSLKLQLHARRLVIAHPSKGMLDLEAPVGPHLAAGLARFGFDPASLEQP